MRILAKRDNLDASTKLIYSQICEKLGIEQVPLSVALLGNYPKVLSYLWEQSSEIFERNEMSLVVNGEVRDKLINFFQEKCINQAAPVNTSKKKGRATTV